MTTTHAARRPQTNEPGIPFPSLPVLNQGGDAPRASTRQRPPAGGSSTGSAMDKVTGWPSVNSDAGTEARLWRVSNQLWPEQGRRYNGDTVGTTISVLACRYNDGV